MGVGVVVVQVGAEGGYLVAGMAAGLVGTFMAVDRDMVAKEVPTSVLRWRSTGLLQHAPLEFRMPDKVMVSAVDPLRAASVV